MLCSKASRVGAAAGPAGRCGRLQRPLAAPISIPRSRGAAVRTRVAQEGLFSDAFKAALQTALKRDESASATMYSEAVNSSREANYSRSEGGYDSGYTRPTAPYVPQVQSATAGPMLQILATALGQSRATLERLQAEEAEIENLIQKERKQVERLEWMLEKVQQDYAYFDQLQKRFAQQSSSSSSSSSGYGASSSSGGRGGEDYGSGSGSGGRWGDESSSSRGYDDGSSSRSYESSGSNGASSGGGRFSSYY